MDWLEIVNTAAAVTSALAITYGIHKGVQLTEKRWGQSYDKRQRAENTRALKDDLTNNEINTISKDMELLWMPLLAMAISSDPENMSEVKTLVKTRINPVRSFFETSNYEFSRRLMTSIDVAFESANKHKNGWSNELIMYTSLECLRAMSHIEDEFTEAATSKCTKFVQVQSDIQRAYETNFHELARLRWRLTSLSTHK